jgi:hypothetical protein
MNGTSGQPAAVEVACLRCGYSLRGLAEGGGCPECGLPVAESRAARLTLDPTALRELRENARVLAWAPVLGGAWVAVALVVGQSLSWIASAAIAIVGCLVGAMLYAGAAIGFVGAAQRVTRRPGSFVGFAAAGAGLLGLVVYATLASRAGWVPAVLVPAALAVSGWTARHALHCAAALGASTAPRWARACLAASLAGIAVLGSGMVLQALLAATSHPQGPPPALRAALGVIWGSSALAALFLNALAMHDVRRAAARILGSLQGSHPRRTSDASAGETAGRPRPGAGSGAGGAAGRSRA